MSAAGDVLAALSQLDRPNPGIRAWYCHCNLSSIGSAAGGTAMIRPLQKFLLIIGLVAVFTLAASPAPAEAQWHGHSRFYVSFGFGGYWPYPYWGPYWGGWGPYWGPRPYVGFGFGY